MRYRTAGISHLRLDLTGRMIRREDVHGMLTFCFRLLQRVHAVLPRFRGLCSLEASDAVEF